VVIFGVVGDLHRQAALRTALTRADYSIVFCAPSEVLNLRREVAPVLVVDCALGLAVLTGIRQAVPKAKLLAIVPAGHNAHAYSSLADGTLNEPFDADAVRGAVEALIPPTSRSDPG
jgi:hypothetical protein